MALASEHLPLLERLHKGANCVVFLDGEPEPAADVADMLRKAAAKIESDAKAIAERDTRIAQLQEANHCIPEFEAKVVDNAKVIAEKDTEIRSMIAVHNSDVDGMRLQEEKIADQKKVIAALREALVTVRLYIADEMIANAIVVPKGFLPSGANPSLLQVVSDAIAATNEQTAGENDGSARR